MKHIGSSYLIEQNIFQNLSLLIENLLCLTVERQIVLLSTQNNIYNLSFQLVT